MKTATYVVAAVAVLGLAGGAWLWWQRQASVPVPVPVPPPQAAAASAAASPAVAAASAPTVRHPIETPVAAEPAAAPLDVEAALTDLFGHKAISAMFQLDDFPRRLVATVDNLGRQHAPVRLWPVNPTAGQFVVEKQGDREVISADNGLRYTPYVLLLETVDLQQAKATYVRLYPLFQQAYQDLGYPKGYFNDRLVEVIDQLLETPEPNGPLKIHLPSINGPVQPERPWVLYEFDDPALQSLSAGQRILLRVGPVNERRIKSKLNEFRRLVTTGIPPR